MEPGPVDEAPRTPDALTRQDSLPSLLPAPPSSSRSSPEASRSAKSSSPSSWAAIPFAKRSPQARRVPGAATGGGKKMGLKAGMERVTSQMTLRGSVAAGKDLDEDGEEERDKDREVGLAVDGSYVETTSLVAAQALAKHYEEQARGRRKGKAKADAEEDDVGEYVVVAAEDRNGRPVYRIRPRSAPRDDSAVLGTPARHFRSRSASSPSAPSPLSLDVQDQPRPGSTTPTPNLPRLAVIDASPVVERLAGGSPTVDASSKPDARSLRLARSNPVLRSPSIDSSSSRPTIAIIKPDARGFYPSTQGGVSKGTLFPTPRPASTAFLYPPPSPSPTPSQAGSSKWSTAFHLRSSRSDVRLLGSSDAGSDLGEREGADVLGRILGWRAGRPESHDGTMWAKPRSSEDQRPPAVIRGSRTTAVEQVPASVEEELPEDLVEELAAAEAGTGGGEEEPPFARERKKSSTRSLASTSPHLGRATVPASSPAPPPPPAPPTRPPRYQNPAMFDLFLSDDIKGAGPFSASTSDVSSLGAPNSSPGGSRYVIFGERPPTPSQDAKSKKKPATRTSGSTGGDGSPSPSSPPSSGKRWTRVPKPSSSDHHLPRSQTTGSPSLSIDDRRSVGSESAAAEGRPIVAATMERWIVELTSRIDAAGLVDFFLTYRSVIKPLDLCRLLISRFEWALSPSLPSSIRRSEDGEGQGAEEEAKAKATKRIVRVRTFVVIRHWLLNHFEDDFLPCRELRSCLTAWLNSIAKDSRVVSAPEEARIVKSLKKVVKQRKETFLGYNLIGRSNVRDADGGEQGKEPLREVKSASTLRGRGLTVPRAHEGRTSDEDVDLEVIPEGDSVARPPNLSDVGGLAYQTRKSMSQPVGLSAMAAAAAATESPPNRKSTALALPQSHSSLNRAFTSTMGTIGRFRRMLNNRSIAPGSSTAHGSCISPTSFAQMDLQPNDTGDLLYVRGGLERYLSFFQLDNSSEGASVSSGSAVAQSSQGSLPSPATTDSLDTPAQSGEEEAVVIVDPNNPLGISGLDGDPLMTLGEEWTPRKAGGPKLVHESASKETIRSEVSSPARRLLRKRDLADVSLEGPSQANSWCFQLSRPTSVQLDDLDLSDASEDEDAFPTARKLRRLPAATDLKQALALRPMSFRSSVGTTSSYGTRRVPSMAASMFRRRAGSMSSSGEGDDEAVVGLPVVENFVAEGLESDDEEPGDVDAALRRLEGVIDADRERDKAKRVEMQMAKSRNAAKRHGMAVPPTDETPAEEDEGSVAADNEEEEGAPSEASEPSTSSALVDLSDSKRGTQQVLLTPAVPSPPRETPQPAPARRASTRRVSRKASLYKLFSTAPTSRPISFRPPPRPSIALPPVHRSFLLSCRTELLARQFRLIERDLLRSVGWQELASGGATAWTDQTARRDALCWEEFLKDQVREKVEGPKHAPPRDVAAVIVRFNLTCNWVASEIVLTAALDERVALLGKFIRLAFKCYRQNNFQTVMQIIHGLQTTWVERLKRTWSRLGIWEARMFRDLKAFTSHQRNFKSLRAMQDSLAEAYGPPGHQQVPVVAPPATESRRMSIGGARPAVPTACIPFLGLYLRDLTMMNELPTFLDPHPPHVAVDVDPTTGLMPFPSSPSDGLDDGDDGRCPLVNVRKFRLVATIVQKVLAFQESAASLPAEATGPAHLYLACLKIKALDGDQLRRLSLMCEPS